MKQFIFISAMSLLINIPAYALSEVETEEIASEFQFSAPRIGSYTQRVKDLAGASGCTKHTWKSRGHAPAGYIKGLALSFARSLCRLNSTTPGAALIMGKADSQRDSKDALTHYRSIFAKLQMNIEASGSETLRAVYTLGAGLGMRESGGAYCVGWDTSAGSRRPSSAGEAGLFQVSYDSIGAARELRQLYNEYLNNPNRCLYETFKEGARCHSQDVLGSGAGAAFQSFNKSCPAFASEYAMTLLRVLRGHFGPINRREAEVFPACNSLMLSVQRLVEDDVNKACTELL